MYDEIFSQITNAANKRNLRDSTIHAYCTSVAHFLKYTDKPIDTIFFCSFFQKSGKNYSSSTSFTKSSGRIIFVPPA